MNNRITIIFIIFFLSLSAYSKSKDNVDPRIKKVKDLKEYLKEKQNELALTIETRWQKKQEYIDERENDKADTDNLKKKQEQLFQEVTRKKEERFSIDNKLQNIKTDLKLKQDDWKYSKDSFSELLKKESEKLEGVFPLDKELKQKELEQIRASFIQDQLLSHNFKKYNDFIINYTNSNKKIKSYTTSVLTNATDAQKLQVIQFGSVSAYGKDSNGSIYTIRQTGRLGAQRFKIDSISNNKVANHISESYNEWLNNNNVYTIPFDILQNNQSSTLIKNENKKYSSKIKEFIKAGGPVMFPLLFLPLWALIIAIIKLIQITNKRKSGKKFSTKVIQLIKEGKNKEAYNLVKNTSGPIAKVVKTCLKHRDWDRETSEKAVREIIVEEIPKLNKNMNTLAVLAAVAPLMGLLGTVSGMIGLFKVITLYGTGDPRIMAGGISEALITTQTGLTIAIPILLLHNFIQNRNNSLHIDMEKSAIKVLNRLWILN